MKTFVDTSAFFAAVDPSDAYHSQGTTLLGNPATPLVTSSVVLAELWNLLHRTFGGRTAERSVVGIVEGGVEVEPVGRGDVLRALEIEEEFSDQGFSLADRTSFAVMHRLGVHRVATFDRHFAIYRFGPGRRKAFEIAR